MKVSNIFTCNLQTSIAVTMKKIIRFDSIDSIQLCRTLLNDNVPSNTEVTLTYVDKISNFGKIKKDIYGKEINKQFLITHKNEKSMLIFRPKIKSSQTDT